MKMNSWGVLACTLVLALVGTAFGGTNTWTDTGPTGANVRVEFSSSPDIVYARGGDKLWRSTDAGQNWTALFSKNAALVPFTVDPTDPNVVITGRGFFNDGIVRTTNGGASFDTQFFPSISAMRFGPDGTVVYGASSVAPIQIIRSIDKGATWTPMASSGLPASPGTQPYVPAVISLAVDRSNPNIVYAGLQHPDYQGVYRSTDAGANWTPATGLLGLTVSEIVSHPTLGVFAATNTGLFSSADMGATWTRITDSASSGVSTTDLSSVAFDRVDPQTLYAGGTLRGEIFFSANGGASWARRDSGVVASKVNTIAPRPGHAGQVLAGTSHTLYRSTDSAQNWAVSANGLYAANITSLHSGSRLRAGLEDGGVYESLDGTTWTPLNNAALRARMPNNRFSLIADMIEANRLLVMPAQSAVLSSATLGNTWEILPPTYPTTILYHFGGLLTLPGSGSGYLAGSNNGIYRTSNDGDTWTWSSTGLPPTTIRDFTKNADGSAIYAATFNQGIYKSTDNGVNWAPANTGLTNLEIQVLDYDTENDVLVVGTNHGLFASNNGGASYTALTNPWPTAQMSVGGLVVEDFVRGAIYVGFQKKVFRSVDSGVTWTELSEGNAYSESVIRITSMIGDGPGVLYLGNMASGLQTYTVSPDIRVVATVPPAGDVVLGTEIPWQFTVQNAGPHASTFTQASWQVPANVDVLNLASSLGSCAVSGARRLSCDFGVLPVSQSATVTMSLRGNAGGTLGINLSAGSAEIDPVPANNTFANSGVRFIEPVDLAASIRSSAAAVLQGLTSTLTGTVTNNSPSDAAGVTATFTLSDRMTFSSATGAVCTSTGNVVVCAVGALGAGSSRDIFLNVNAVSAGTAMSTVTVASVLPDLVLPDNAASVTVTINPANDLNVTLAGNNAAFTGNAYVLTITAQNLTGSEATGVRAALTLSSSLTYASATGAACTTAAAVVNCDLGSIAGNGSKVVSITVNAVTAGVATNTVTVSSANPDPMEANNQSSAAVLINVPVPPDAGSNDGGGGGGAVDLLSVFALLGVLASMQRRRRRAASTAH